jgi:hypothetical protein
MHLEYQPFCIQINSSAGIEGFPKFQFVVIILHLLHILKDILIQAILGKHPLGVPGITGGDSMPDQALICLNVFPRRARNGVPPRTKEDVSAFQVRLITGDGFLSKL